MCKVNHNPPHSYGDCVRACVATIIDRDDVPHAFTGDAEDAWNKLRKYLKLSGKTISLFSLENAREEMKLNNPDVVYMLIGETNAGVYHAVVAQGVETLHNPSIMGGDVEKPISMIEGYIVAIIGDLIA